MTGADPDPRDHAEHDHAPPSQDPGGDPGQVGPFGRLEALHPAVRVLWRLAGLGRAAFLSAASVVLSAMVTETGALRIGATVFVVLAAALVLWVPAQRYRRLRFSVDDRFLYVRDGVIRHREKVIPVSRMQHVDIQRGMIERTLGLASLAVFTAGGPGATFRLPGLTLERGRELRDRILAARESA